MSVHVIAVGMCAMDSIFFVPQVLLHTDLPEIAASLLTLLFLFPLYWLFMISFKTPDEIFIQTALLNSPVRERVATWLEGQCVSFGQSIPFLPLVDQLRENFGIEEFDGEPEIIAKIEQLIHEGSVRRLLIKDVDRRPFYKRWFTHALDKLMDPGAAVRYWDAEELGRLLQDVGFTVHRHLMVDILPYPHILYVCERRP